jgi:carboxymethylenebutenolidase
MHNSRLGRAGLIVTLAATVLLTGIQLSAKPAAAEPAVLRTTTSIAAQAPAEEVTFPSGGLVLHGFIYKPDGPGPFPAVLWNHGSEQPPGWLPRLGPMFTSQGYVFFIPHRRGQGRSPGPYIMDLLNRERQERGAAARSRLLVVLQEEHLEDQMAGLSYLRGLPYVDSTRIAVVGCSFGGVQTVLAAERNAGLRAAINFAGAAQTWRGSPDLRERLLSAVRQATVPMLFIQAENDYDLTPTFALAGELERLSRQPRVLIFPRFGETAEAGHDFCRQGGNVWGDQVFDFLREAMR